MYLVIGYAPTKKGMGEPCVDEVHYTRHSAKQAIRYMHAEGLTVAVYACKPIPTSAFVLLTEQGYTDGPKANN